ncbi:hypothetical protein [Paenibacillus agilis]|nr:hypothetical protein [Paenibacillus agilis]
MTGYLYLLKSERLSLSSNACLKILKIVTAEQMKGRNGELINM